jgi:hypothetical protein
VGKEVVNSPPPPPRLPVFLYKNMIPWELAGTIAQEYDSKDVSVFERLDVERWSRIELSFAWASLSDPHPPEAFRMNSKGKELRQKGFASC